jgi:ADP-heptose:LPS heptosyltransferase
VTPGADVLRFPVWAGDEEEHRRLINHHGIVPGGYAVIHPGATSPSRRWPAERFAEVGDALAGQGLTIVTTGTAAEAALTAQVVDSMARHAVDLTGRTTLGGFAALLRDSAVVVGNDTGTAHLAAAVGARTVTVFLSGDAVRWSHRGPGHLLVRAGVGCNPCRHLACPIDHRCATAVTGAQVVAQARRVLSRGAGRSAVP